MLSAASRQPADPPAARDGFFHTPPYGSTRGNCSVLPGTLGMGHFWDTMRFGTVDYFALPMTVLLLIALALTFDFTNGIHDAANSIATVVSTRVLSPRTAVVWAAFFNFIAFAVFHLKVAGTMGKGLVDPDIVDYEVIAATLFSAIAWNLFT